jgi:hypothetical protein
MKFKRKGIDVKESCAFPTEKEKIRIKLDEALAEEL